MAMLPGFRHSLAAAALLLLAGVELLADQSEKTVNGRVYGHLENFIWREYLMGREVVRDSGPVYGLGANVSIAPYHLLRIEADSEFYFGNLDYDGFIQSMAGAIPHRSKSQYLGLKASGDLALKFDLRGGFYLKPYLGIGANGWQRKLDNAGGRVFGYDERWLTVYGLAGLGAGAPAGRALEFFGKAELQLPVFNAEQVDLSNLGGPANIYLKPGRQASLNLEAGVNVFFVSLSFFYETLRFSASDPDNKYAAFFQPKSNADLYGLKLGAVF